MADRGESGKNVLWVDNDPGYIQPFVLALREEGFAVKVASSVSWAEKLLSSEVFNLLILDVMIPTIDDAEEATYRPEETDDSLKTGLLFYRREKDLLAKQGTRVFVMTVRIDKGIRAEFIASGLPEADFATKMELREIPKFIARINSLLGQGARS
jgi:CheY-like chemotaxis protein